MRPVEICLLFAVLCLLVASCASTGPSTGQQTATYQGSVKLNKPVSPVIFFPTGAINVGESLGYKMSNVNRATNKEVWFSNGSAFAASVRKTNVTTVHLSLRGDSQTVDIFVSVQSNSDTKDVASKIIDNFKEGLLKKF